MIIHQSYHYAHHWILTLLILIAKTKTETYLTICLTLHLRMKHTNEPEVKDFHGPKDIFTCVRDQSCPTLCNPMDCSPPGSSVLGILLARILEWVTMPSSRGSSCPQDRTWVFMSTALVGGFFTTNSTWEAPIPFYLSHIQWTDSYLLLVYTSLAYAISFWDQPQRKGNDWVFARKVDRMNLMSCMPQEGHWVI